MNAYEKSVALELTGTDAEQVAILQTLTISDISTRALARLLREESLLLWTGEKYVGSIETVVKAEGASEAFVAGIDELKSAVFGGSAESVLTTVPKWSQKVWAIVSAIVALVPDAAGLIDRVYALDGGRPYKDLTAEQFAAQRTAAAEATQLADDIDALNSDWTAILNDGGINVALAAGDRDGLKTALAAAIEVL